MSHPQLGHDYSERTKEESKKEYKKRKATALGIALGNQTGSRKLKVQSSGHGDKQYFYDSSKKSLRRPLVTEYKQRSSNAHNGEASKRQLKNY